MATFEPGFIYCYYLFILYCWDQIRLFFRVGWSISAFHDLAALNAKGKGRKEGEEERRREPPARVDEPNRTVFSKKKKKKREKS